METLTVIGCIIGFFILVVISTVIAVLTKRSESTVKKDEETPDTAIKDVPSVSDTVTDTSGTNTVSDSANSSTSILTPSIPTPSINIMPNSADSSTGTDIMSDSTDSNANILIPSTSTTGNSKASQKARSESEIEQNSISTSTSTTTPSTIAPSTTTPSTTTPSTTTDSVKRIYDTEFKLEEQSAADYKIVKEYGPVYLEFMYNNLMSFLIRIDDKKVTLDQLKTTEMYIGQLKNSYYVIYTKTLTSKSYLTVSDHADTPAEDAEIYFQQNSSTPQENQILDLLFETKDLGVLSILVASDIEKRKICFDNIKQTFNNSTDNKSIAKFRIHDNKNPDKIIIDRDLKTDTISTHKIASNPGYPFFKVNIQSTKSGLLTVSDNSLKFGSSASPVFLVSGSQYYGLIIIDGTNIYHLKQDGTLSQKVSAENEFMEDEKFMLCCNINTAKNIFKLKIPNSDKMISLANEDTFKMKFADSGKAVVIGLFDIYNSIDTFRYAYIDRYTTINRQTLKHVLYVEMYDSEGKLYYRYNKQIDPDVYNRVRKAADDFRYDNRAWSIERKSFEDDAGNTIIYYAFRSSNDQSLLNLKKAFEKSVVPKTSTNKIHLNEMFRFIRK